MEYQIEFEREEDGRWIAEILTLRGVMANGVSKAEAESKVEAMALRVIADRIERDSTTMTRVHSLSHERVAKLQGAQGL